MYDPCTSSTLAYTCKDLVQRAEPLYKDRRYQRKGNKAPEILGNKYVEKLSSKLMREGMKRSQVPAKEQWCLAMPSLP